MVLVSHLAALKDFCDQQLITVHVQIHSYLLHIRGSCGLFLAVCRQAIEVGALCRLGVTLLLILVV
jgi:hypothetical protein